MFPQLSFKRKVVDGVFHCPPSLEGKRVSNPNPFCHFVSDFIEPKKSLENKSGDIDFTILDWSLNSVFFVFRI